MSRDRNGIWQIGRRCEATHLLGSSLIDKKRPPCWGATALYLHILVYVESETKTEKGRGNDFSGYELLGFWARTVPTKVVCVSRIIKLWTARSSDWPYTGLYMYAEGRRGGGGLEYIYLFKQLVQAKLRNWWSPRILSSIRVFVVKTAAHVPQI